MLLAKAEIIFTLSDKNYIARKDFRVPFNFGEDLLFSGNIISNHQEYINNEKYLVSIEFFTIEGEAYDAVKHLLLPGSTIAMQAGSRLLGKAKLLEFDYVA
ncbi:MAG: hypothetical protein FWG88_10880 [Oscillospiraceae bacterium]|nr:hypothetical protein [Oscillospiraceae bacterium]